MLQVVGVELFQHLLNLVGAQLLAIHFQVPAKRLSLRHDLLKILDLVGLPLVMPRLGLGRLVHVLPLQVQPRQPLLVGLMNSQNLRGRGQLGRKASQWAEQGGEKDGETSDRRDP